jgi:hypothetical protein
VPGLDGPAYGSAANPEPLDEFGNSLLPDPLARWRRARQDTPLAAMAREARAWGSPAVMRQRRLSAEAELSRAASAEAAGEAARFAPSHITHRNPRPGTGRGRLDPRVSALDRLDAYGSTRPAEDYPGEDYDAGAAEAARGDYDAAHYDRVGGVSFGVLAEEGLLDPDCEFCAPVLARLGGDW